VGYSNTKEKVFSAISWSVISMWSLCKPNTQVHGSGWSLTSIPWTGVLMLHSAHVTLGFCCSLEPACIRYDVFVGHCLASWPLGPNSAEGRNDIWREQTSIQSSREPLCPE
jgi:hypothetical protein